ncbi:MAG TPA: NAD(P)-dependent alcohol dehydrogenase [Gammaproteobacteria bacterium]|nr:NAD(P)-dependent alcohol dehydrogenase [Gammaproteobacteria bacterium]
MRPHASRVLYLAAGLTALLAAGAQAQTVRQYVFEPRADGQAYQLAMKEVPRPTAGPHEVLVRMHAAGLNGADDLRMLDAKPGTGRDFTGGIPLTDGAGEVIALGKDVTRFKIGDRVVGIYFPTWIRGKPTREALRSPRRGPYGMLSEVVAANEEGLVRVPDYLSYEEAATLPTSGVTAWSALFKYGRVQPGQYVLLEGTGGVSTFGLLFAKAAGAMPIVTSSSDSKLERARALGAVGTANYRTNPDWQENVRALTGGAGVDHVLDVGGKDTLPRAMQALAFGGHIALIGDLSGDLPEIPNRLGPGASLTFVLVGSREDFEAMSAFCVEHQIHPLIARVFEFEHAPEAFEFAHGDPMGKVVIRF